MIVVVPANNKDTINTEPISEKKKKTMQNSATDNGGPINNSSHKSSKKKNCVDFSKNDNIVHDVESVVEEYGQFIWYNKDEIIKMAAHNQLAANQINNGESVEETELTTNRGLESLIIERAEIFRTRLDKARDAVLSEQKRQKEKEICEPNIIAMVYRRRGGALKCQEEANAIAKNDHKEVAAEEAAAEEEQEPDRKKIGRSSSAPLDRTDIQKKPSRLQRIKRTFSSDGSSPTLTRMRRAAARKKDDETKKEDETTSSSNIRGGRRKVKRSFSSDGSSPSLTMMRRAAARRKPETTSSNSEGSSISTPRRNLTRHLSFSIKKTQTRATV